MNISLEDLYSLLQKVDKNGEDIKADISVIKEDLKNTSQKFDSKIENLAAENQILKRRIIACERKIKKNNIIIYGLETDKASILETTLNFIKDKLNIRLDLSDVDDCYQLNNNNASKPMILLALISHLKKSEIFQNISKLKQTGVSFADDLPYEDRQERKLLNEHLKTAKANNIAAKIIRNKIIIAGATYTLAELSDQTSPGPSTAETQTIDNIENNTEQQTSSKKDKKKQNQTETVGANKISTRNQQPKK